jgi:hypothetical protein
METKMTKMVRTVVAADILLLKAAIKNAGIKARVRKFPTSVRVVFDCKNETMMEVLNSEGFLHASGGPFGWSSFQGNQAFVCYMAV